MLTDLLKEKTPREQANLKAEEIAKTDFTGEHLDRVYGLRVEIESLVKIEGGVEIFARAWRGKKQLGFGPDGTVEIERFRFFNPPILVNDEMGVIDRSTIDSEGILHMRRFREDPVQSFKDQLFHTIEKVGREDTEIEIGSRGNTTDTFFADSGGGGTLSITATTNATTYAAAHDATSSDSNDASVNDQNEVFAVQYLMMRSPIPFDTSAIPDTDVINSAVISVFPTGATRSGDGSSCTVVQFSGSNTTRANADYDKAKWGTTSGGATLLSSLPADGSYHDITLNATGLGWVSTTGYTAIGLRDSNDIANSAPTGINARMAAQGSADANPCKMVVVHTAGAAASSVVPTLLLMNVG